MNKLQTLFLVIISTLLISSSAFSAMKKRNCAQEILHQIRNSKVLNLYPGDIFQFITKTGERVQGRFDFIKDGHVFFRNSLGRLLEYKIENIEASSLDVLYTERGIAFE